MDGKDNDVSDEKPKPKPKPKPKRVKMNFNIGTRLGFGTLLMLVVVSTGNCEAFGFDRDYVGELIEGSKK